MAVDFVILGGTGIQGRICARDLLASGYSVLLCGRDSSAVTPLLHRWKKQAFFQYLDLHNASRLIKTLRLFKPKVVINCAELTLNMAVMRACLEVGISCTDLGGLQRITAQQFSLHRAFEKKNLLCITGCGSTPGIANVMAHYGTTLLDSVQSINLGFAWDSKPKIFVVPYSLQSIFAEFQEKPVVFEKGVFRTRAPYELIQTFRQIGPQRIKGIVHSEVYTFPRYFPSLRSVRYFAGFPEHSRSYIEALRALQGDKDHELPYTLQLLKKLIPPPGYKEWEVIWVKLKGMFRHKPRNILMECFIRTQKGWEDAGSNIGTGRTISVISQMLAKGEIHARGVHAPEGVVPWKPFFAALHTRGMFVYCNGKRLRVA